MNADRDSRKMAFGRLLGTLDSAPKSVRTEARDSLAVGGSSFGPGPQPPPMQSYVRERFLRAVRDLIESKEFQRDRRREP
jgi:hypothetical protein